MGAWKFIRLSAYHKNEARPSRVSPSPLRRPSSSYQSLSFTKKRFMTMFMSVSILFNQDGRLSLRVGGLQGLPPWPPAGALLGLGSYFGKSIFE